MKILGIYDSSGPKYWRILLPLSLMPDVELRIVKYPTNETLEWADICFFNRGIGKTMGATIPEFMADAKERHGVKFVCDLDDHWILDPSHILIDTYKERGLSQMIEEYTRNADCVFVTHERLYDEVKALHTNIHIIPNAIPKVGQFAFKKTESDLTRLFWAGSITHEKDITLLRNPVKKFNTLPVKMVLGGYSANPILKRMASAFTHGGTIQNKLIEALPVESYYACYSECDIALIPLVDNSFNRYKSNLKILEAANVCAPCIVSNVHPYKDMQYVNYVDKQSDWYRHVKRLLDSPGEAVYQGEKLAEYCREHFNFDKINIERKQIFNSLLN